MVHRDRDTVVGYFIIRGGIFRGTRLDVQILRIHRCRVSRIRQRSLRIATFTFTNCHTVSTRGISAGELNSSVNHATAIITNRQTGCGNINVRFFTREEAVARMALEGYSIGCGYNEGHILQRVCTGCIGIKRYFTAADNVRFRRFPAGFSNAAFNINIAVSFYAYSATCNKAIFLIINNAYISRSVLDPD